MSTVVRISRKLIDRAKVKSKIENRSVTEQIEYWAKIGKIAEENPGLPYNLIREILEGMEQIDNGDKTEYKLG